MARLQRPLPQTPPWDNPSLYYDCGLGQLHGTSSERGPQIEKHLEKLAQMGVPAIYSHAYQRQLALAADQTRFASWFARLDGRLYLGTGMPHVLESNLTRSRPYGLPLIPGSALKNAAQRGANHLDLDPKARRILFGHHGDDPDNLEAGYLHFHDAWWIPQSAPTPFALEVITVHHPDYYQSQGQTPATDFDSPNPNFQLTARGSFLILVEGPLAWAQLGLQALKLALVHEGLGGKNSSGYGYFHKQDDQQARQALQAIIDQQEQADQPKTTPSPADTPPPDLDDNQRRLFQLNQLLQQANELNQRNLLDQTKRDELYAAINELLKAAPHWPETERHKAADWIEATYDLLGWRNLSGKKGKQQETKRRKKLQQLRETRP